MTCIECGKTEGTKLYRDNIHGFYVELCDDERRNPHLVPATQEELDLDVARAAVDSAEKEAIDRNVSEMYEALIDAGVMGLVASLKR